MPNEAKVKEVADLAELFKGAPSVAVTDYAGLTVEKSTYVNVVLFPLILPAVLLLKLKERLFPKPNDTRSNLTHKPGKLANSILAAIFGGEGRILRHISAPAGHSLVLVARKPE